MSFGSSSLSSPVAISSPRVKVVVRGIIAPELHFPALRCAFLRRRRKSANRVNPLDERDTTELSASRISGHREQQPRNCIGIRRIGFGCHLAGDLAAVVKLPYRSAKMLSDWLTLLVE